MELSYFPLHFITMTAFVICDLLQHVKTQRNPDSDSESMD
jgi:hypothetical protein